MKPNRDLIPWLLFAPWMKPFACSVPYISIVGAAVVTRVDVFSHFLKKVALRVGSNSQ